MSFDVSETPKEEQEKSSNPISLEYGIVQDDPPDYFDGLNNASLQGLKEQAQLEDNISFVESILADHPLADETKTASLESLGHIQKRSADPNLYLGVIGEFSCGKSTFLNAIMEDDLLKTNILQATTAATTWMLHREKLDVEIEFGDGEIKTYRKDGNTLFRRFIDFFYKPSFNTEKERIKAFIHAVTAEEEIARQLRKVSVFHPCELFKKGLVICDTPGANAENQRHVEVASNTIVNDCDAAIVIIPADIPVSASLLSFLNANLGENAHRCIFVVTKLDLVGRERHWPHLLQTIRNRIAQGLNLDHVNLLACAPGIIVDILAGEELTINEKKQAKFIEQFSEAKEIIWKTLRANREIIQMERLAVLMSRLFLSLESELLTLKTKYQEEHAALEENQMEDFGTFAQGHRERLEGMLHHEKRAYEDKALEIIDKVRNDSLNKIKAKLYAFEERDKFNKFVKEGLQARLDLIFPTLAESLNTEVFDSMQAKSTECYSAFEEVFKEKYESLATLGGKLSFSTYGEQLSSKTSFERATSNSVQSAVDAINRNEAELIKDSAVGAATGAAIGTFILPGLGAFLGGALGAAFGSIFAKSLDQMKSEIWIQVSAELEKNFSEISRSSAEDIERALGVAISAMGKKLDLYVQEYDDLVRAMIARDEQQKNKLKSWQEKIDEDHPKLSRRLKSLNKVRMAMKTVNQRKESV